MGDIADWMIGQALDQGEYFSRYSRGWTRARQRGYTAPANPPPTCNKCGKTDLKWIWNDGGRWQLFEIERGEHNRNVPHQCHPTTADDFEDCGDLV